MSQDKRYVVPEGMFKAFHLAENHEGLKWDDKVLDKMLEAALRWLAENPIVPKQAEAENLTMIRPIELFQIACREWQARMFLAPEPEVPEEIKDVFSWCDVYFGDHQQLPALKETIISTFRRGQRAKVKP